MDEELEICRNCALNIETSDIISIASLAVTVTIAIIVFNYTRKQERRLNTLHLHGIWENLHEARVRTYYGISAMIQDNSIADKVPAHSIAESPYRSDLGRIEHFFSDLYALLTNNCLDDKLAEHLFLGTATLWKEKIFSHIMFNDEGENTKFFNESMFPLWAELDRRSVIKSGSFLRKIKNSICNIVCR